MDIHRIDVIGTEGFSIMKVIQENHQYHGLRTRRGFWQRILARLQSIIDFSVSGTPYTKFVRRVRSKFIEPDPN